MLYFESDCDKDYKKGVGQYLAAATSGKKEENGY